MKCAYFTKVACVVAISIITSVMPAIAELKINVVSEINIPAEDHLSKAVFNDAGVVGFSVIEKGTSSRKIYKAALGKTPELLLKASEAEVLGVTPSGELLLWKSNYPEKFGCKITKLGAVEEVLFECPSFTNTPHLLGSDYNRDSRLYITVSPIDWMTPDIPIGERTFFLDINTKTSVELPSPPTNRDRNYILGNGSYILSDCSASHSRSGLWCNPSVYDLETGKLINLTHRKLPSVKREFYNFLGAVGENSFSIVTQRKNQDPKLLLIENIGQRVNVKSIPIRFSKGLLSSMEQLRTPNFVSSFPNFFGRLTDDGKIERASLLKVLRRKGILKGEINLGDRSHYSVLDSNSIGTFLFVVDTYGEQKWHDDLTGGRLFLISAN